MDWMLLTSSVLQSVAALWAGVLLARRRSGPSFVLFLLFSLMALRRLIDLFGVSSGSDSHDLRALMQGIVLLISVVSVLTVGWLEYSRHRRGRGEREARLLASAVEGSATAAMITSAGSRAEDRIIEFVNDAMLALTGRDRASMIGKSMAEIFGPESEEEAARACHAIDLALPLVTEAVMPGADGGTRWVSCSMSPIRAEAGPPTRLLWIKHDITERRRIEDELRKQQERYQRIVETADEGVWLVDAEWRTTYVNTRIAEMLRTNPADMVGRPVTDFVFPEDIPALNERRRQRERGARGQHDERLRRADGSELWTIMSTNAFFDPKGRFEGALAMITDITDRRATEAGLREALQRLSFHVNNSPLAVIEWDREFRVSAWSSGAQRMFGWEAAEVIGKHPSEWRVVHEEDQEEVARVISRLHTGAEPRNLCLNRNYTKSNETIWCQWYNSVLFEPDGSVNSIVSLAQDVTERHRADERQHMLMLELDHRVRNNLATVLGIAQQTLSVSGTIDEFAGAFTGRIVSLARAHALLSRASWEGVDLFALCSNILESAMSGPAPRVIAEGPPVRLTASQSGILALTLHELMTNAVKYGALSTPAGRVRIGWASYSTGPECSLRIEWKEEGGPSVAQPTRTGFGSTFIEAAVAYELKGSARFAYDPSGFQCELIIPLPACTFTPGKGVLTGATA